MVAGAQREGSTAPGAASAARAGVDRLVLLGDPPSFDEDDSDPHCCVKPLDAVALPSRAATAACRTRHGPSASCSAPMASRLRCLVTVYGPGCLPGHRDYLKRHDSLGFDAGLLLRPVVPRAPSERLARPPPAVSGCPPRPQSGAWRIRFDSPPPPVDRAAWRIRAHAGASPAASPPYSRIAALRFGTSASASTSYGCRARTGFPPAVWSPSLSGWLPTTPPQGGSHMAATIAPAPKRHQRNLLITLAAAARKADLAARHYRIPACSLGTPHRACDVPRRVRRVVTGTRAGPHPSPGRPSSARGASYPPRTSHRWPGLMWIGSLTRLSSVGHQAAERQQGYGAHAG